MDLTEGEMTASSLENSSLFGPGNQFNLLKVGNPTYFPEWQGPLGLQRKCDCSFVEADIDRDNVKFHEITVLGLWIICTDQMSRSNSEQLQDTGTQEVLHK